MKAPKGRLKVTAVVPKGIPRKAAVAGAGKALQGVGKALGSVGKRVANVAPMAAGPRLGAAPLGTGVGGPMAPKLTAPRGRRL